MPLTRRSPDAAGDPGPVQIAGEAHANHIPVNNPATNIEVRFDVLGVPRPQGSKRAFAVNGKARLAESGGTAVAAWRNAVADKARAVAGEHGTFSTAVSVRVAFVFPMPASRTRAQHNAGMIPKTTAPDIDKLLRAMFDGFTAGGLIRDDALIVEVASTKVELSGGWSGASVTISEVAR